MGMGYAIKGMVMFLIYIIGVILLAFYSSNTLGTLVGIVLILITMTLEE